MSKKPKFDPDDVQHRIGAMFTLLDGITGQFRQRIGSDPTPLRLRIGAMRQQQNSGHNAQFQLGRILGRFRGQPQPTQEQEYQDDEREMPEEGTLEYWEMMLQELNNNPPKHGTREHFEHQRKIGVVKSKIDRLRKPHQYTEASIIAEKPEKYKKKTASSIAPND